MYFKSLETVKALTEIPRVARQSKLSNLNIFLGDHEGSSLVYKLKRNTCYLLEFIIYMLLLCLWGHCLLLSSLSWLQDCHHFYNDLTLKLQEWCRDDYVTHWCFSLILTAGPSDFLFCGSSKIGYTIFIYFLCWKVHIPWFCISSKLRRFVGCIISKVTHISFLKSDLINLLNFHGNMEKLNIWWLSDRS